MLPIISFSKLPHYHTGPPTTTPAHSMSARTTHSKPPHKKSHRGRGGAPKAHNRITYTRVVGIQYPNALLAPTDYQLSKILPYMKDPKNHTDDACTHGKVRWRRYINDGGGMASVYEYHSKCYNKWCEIITQEIARCSISSHR